MVQRWLAPWHCLLAGHTPAAYPASNCMTVHTGWVSCSKTLHGLQDLPGRQCPPTCVAPFGCGMLHGCCSEHAHFGMVSLQELMCWCHRSACNTAVYQQHTEQQLLFRLKDDVGCAAGCLQEHLPAVWLQLLATHSKVSGEQAQERLAAHEAGEGHQGKLLQLALHSLCGKADCQDACFKWRSSSMMLFCGQQHDIRGCLTRSSHPLNTSHAAAAAAAVTTDNPDRPIQERQQQQPSAAEVAAAAAPSAELSAHVDDSSGVAAAAAAVLDGVPAGAAASEQQSAVHQPGEHDLNRLAQCVTLKQRPACRRKAAAILHQT